MPIFDDEDSLFKIEFSDKSSLNLTKREGYGSAVSLRQILKTERMIKAANDRKRLLENKIEAITDPDELLKLQAKIEAEEKNADVVASLVDLVYECFSGWDRYATRADMEKGNPKPFTKENIATIHLNKLKLIVQRVSEEIVGGMQDDPKPLLNESDTPSLSASTVQ